MSVTRQLHLLLIDDSEDTTDLLKTFLSDPAIDLTIAHSGKEGVELFRTRHFDLVLMDIEMPDMNGFQANAVIRQIEQEQGMAKTPILALTAASDINSSYMIMSAAFDFQVVKPISRVTLLQIIGQFQQARSTAAT